MAINAEAMHTLCFAIQSNQLWATPEETDAWLKTETGKRISAMIEALRQEDKKKKGADHDGKNIQ